MAHPEETAGTQPQLSAAQRARVDVQIGHLLTDPTLSDADVVSLVDSVAATVSPRSARPAPPPPPAVMHEPEPEWMQDQSLSVAPPIPTRESALSGGGGAVSRPAAPSAPTSAVVADDDDDELYPLWRPPARPPIEVPDNVAALTPVDDLTPDPEPPLRADEPDQPTIATVVEAAMASRRRLAAVKDRWVNLAGWIKVAVIVAGVVSLLVVQQILSASRAAVEPDLAGPPAAVVTPTAEPGGPVEGPLQPGCPPNSAPGCLPVTADDCPGGSTDPGLAFGADTSQAWICGRAHNIDLQQIVIELPRPGVVTSILVVPGFAFVEPNGEDRWLEHRLVTAINWDIGGQAIVQQIKPTRDGAVVPIPHVATQRIIATILASEAPPAVNSGGQVLPRILGGPDSAKVDESIAISRITITGYPAGAT